MSPSSQLVLALLFVCTGAFQVHSQQVEVLAGRLDTVRSGAVIIRQLSEDVRFRRGETIELQFNIEAVIDSTSTLTGRRFVVIGGPLSVQTDNWVNGVHDFSERRVYHIKPRKRGRLVVPAMTLYSAGVAYRSEPLELVVER